MASWHGDSSGGHQWGEPGRLNPPTSLADVLEASQAREGSGRREEAPLSWADLLKTPGSTSQAAASPTPPLLRQPHKDAAAAEEDPLLAEAAKSQPDLSGKIRCLGCGRVAASHKALAQHLKDKHQGLNSLDAPGSTNEQTGTRNNRPATLFSLGDVLAASKAPKRGMGSKPAATSQQPPGLRLTQRQLRNMRGLVKAYPTKQELAKAIRGQLGGAAGSKKLSRLKRVILRERSDKAAAAASVAATNAAAVAEHAEAARAAVVASFQEAEAELEAEKKMGRIPAPTLVTKVQVLEMALAEAGRRVEEAVRKVKEAEAAAAKASESRARVWKEPLGGEPEQPAAASRGPADSAAQLQASQPVRLASGTGQEDVAAVPPGGGAKSVAGNSGEGLQLPQLPEEELVEGLQGFENVLASWLHDAHDQAAQSAGWLDIPDDESPEPVIPQEDADATGVDAESLAASDGLGPDGWDDVLAAWMSNAGVIGAPPEPQPETPRHEPAPEASPAKTSASFRESEGGTSPGAESHPVLFRAAAGFDTVISPRSADAESGPQGTSVHSGQPSRKEGQAGGSEGVGGAPRPLLADVLAGGQLSNDALLDLRVSLNESLDLKSDEERQPGGVFAARAAGGGAVALPELRNLGSWGQWPSANEEPNRRWLGEGQQVPPLPAESLQTRMNPFAARSAIDRATSNASRQAAKPQGQAAVDLFGQASSLSSMADLGLTSLPSADSHVHGSKLYHNVLTASQQRLLEGLPPPKNRQAPGEPPLARLPSITGSAPARAGTPLADSSTHTPSPAWMQSSGGGNETNGLAGQAPLASKRSVSLPTGQASRSLGSLGQSQVPQQSSRIHRQSMWPVDSLPWPMNCAPEFDPAMFQGFPYGGHGGYQEMEHYPQPPLLHSHISMPEFLPGSMGLGIGGGIGQRRSSADAAAMGLPGGRPGIPGMHFPGGHVDHFGMYGMPDNFGPPVPMPGQMMPSQLLGHDPNPFQSFLSGGSLGSSGGGLPGGRAGPGGKTPAAHEFQCEVCRVTCCGLANFQQHCSSKRHLRKAAAAGALAIPDLAGNRDGEEGESQQASNPTYVGLQAQCRNYCKQIITTDLNKVVVELLQSLLFWQERSKAMNAHNAARKKRLVSGLREVAKAIKLRKARTVIVTPNIEQIETEGGLDDLLTSILQQAEESETPVVFALSRKKLGQVFGCRKKMSAIAVLDYSGAEALYKQMEQLAEEGRQAWRAHQEAIKNGTAVDTPSADSGSEADEDTDAVDAPTAVGPSAAPVAARFESVAAQGRPPTAAHLG